MSWRAFSLDDSVPEPLSASTPVVKDGRYISATVYSMNKTDLKQFTLKLLQKVSGKTDPWFSRQTQPVRPAWWPAKVPLATSLTDLFTDKYWRENVHQIVECCYEYLGVEGSPYVNRISPSIQSASMRNLVTESSPSPGKSYKPQQEDISFHEIFMCYNCEEEFNKREELKQHYTVCDFRPPELEKIPESPLSSPHKQGPPQMSPLPRNSDCYNRVPIADFTRSIDLLPAHKAARMRKQHRPSLEINCEELDVTEPQGPLSPVTPRTPKSLISQLSRDDSGPSMRKRLRYSISEKGVESEEESESGDEQDNVNQGKKTALNLLTIDISSFLGQRIQKHVHVDLPTHLVEDTENFCRTPVKNSFLEKLRTRPPTYPITYKPRRQYKHISNHLYKFSRSQKQDNRLKLKTGLNRKGRELLQKIEQSKVVMHCMTRIELKRWVPIKVLDKQLKLTNTYSKKPSVASIFPQEPVLLSKNIDRLLGLKKRSKWSASRLRSPLSLSNFVSEEMEAEVAKQRLTLYRSLLNEFSIYQKDLVSKHGKDSESEAAQRKKSTAHVTTKLQKETETKTLKVLMKDCNQSMKPEPKVVNKAISSSSLLQNKRKMLLVVNVTDSVPVKSPMCSAKSFCSFSSGSDDFEDEEKMKHSDSMTDSISILSISSDADSVNSNCCAGCRSHLLCRSTNASLGRQKREEETGLNKLELKNETTAKRKILNYPELMVPLEVKVDNTLLPYSQSGVSMAYGVPSPVSVTKEPIFTPYGDGILCPSKKAESSDVKQDFAGDSQKTSPVKTGNKSKASSKSKGWPSEKQSIATKKRTNSPITRQSKVFTDRINLLKMKLEKKSEKNHTRSRSQNLPQSPHRKSDQTGKTAMQKAASSSLPSSPTKFQSTRAQTLSFDAKKIGTRYTTQQKTLGLSDDNQYSLRSGNFVFTSKVSPMKSKSVESVERVSTSTSSSPLREKRKASPSKLDTGQASKLRRVQRQLEIDLV